MLRALVKLLLNFGPRAVSVLGPGGYVRMVGAAVRHLPSIARRADLRALDRAMGRRPVRVRYLGRRFTLDCPTVDAVITDGTYTFGLVRELFVRNCYVRHGLRAALDSADTVLDLGANRGLFSTMAATTARRVVAVEVLPEFVAAIEANAQINDLRNVAITPAFVGAGGEYEDAATVTMTIDDLLREHGLERFDLVKIDIEGSEFALFADAGWLDRCGAVCMEIHPAFGRVADVLDALRAHGFACVCGDHTFAAVDD
ncbi:MAG: FkbM family methyltransferase, partial [Planctomycetota bacterium]